MPTDTKARSNGVVAEVAAAPAPRPRRHFLAERIERVELPADYAPHWVDLYTNPTDAEGAALNGKSLAEYLAFYIRGWDLVDADDQPAPIAEATFEDLPTKLLWWLHGEISARVGAPLVPPSPAPSNSTTATAP